MKQHLLQKLTAEWHHFQNLGANLQKLMLSYAFYLMAKSLLDVFMSAFLWRQADGAVLIILYYLGWVLGLPLGFWGNGWLLKKFHINHLYFVGVVFQSVGAALAIFSPTITATSVLLYGIVFGVTASFFWGNKNSLSYLLSQGKDRMYYTSLESALRLCVNVVVPVVVGWLVIWLESWLSITGAYKILIMAASILLLISGLLMRYAKFADIHTTDLFVRHHSFHWNMARAVNAIYSLLFGINLFYPALLILHFGAKEGVLGTLLSLMQLAAAASLYIAGRKMRPHHIVPFMHKTHLAYLITSLLLLWQFNWQMGILYLLVQVMIEAIRWSSTYTQVQAAMDTQMTAHHINTSYAYIFDNEIFFNLGRLVSIGLFLVAMQIWSLELAIRVIPVVIVATQFAIIWPLKQLIKLNQRQALVQ